MDCAFIILEHLDFDDLLAVAQISDEISTVAASVFRLKYSHFQIDVRYDFEFPEKPSKLLNVAGMKIDSKTIARVLRRFGISPKKTKTNWHNFTMDPTIYLNDFHSIFNAFQNFGHLIRKLKFSSALKQDTKAEFMGNLISEFISDSLVEFVFEHSNDNLLSYITKPLANVETVRLEMVDLKVFPNSLPLNELFPAMRSLELDSLQRVDSLNCHMPNLEHVSIKDIYVVIPLENIIMNNPQIKSVHLYNNRPQLIQMIGTNLPQLETLSLFYFFLSNENIRLENVTKLFFDLRFGSLKGMHFPRLQILHIGYSNDRFDECHQFLNEHNHLQHLFLKHQNLRDSRFQQLTTNLTNLTEMTLEIGMDEFIHTGETLSADAIVEFVRSHDKVNHLNLINSDDQCIAEIKEALKHGWDSKTIQRGVSFERKTNN